MKNQILASLILSIGITAPVAVAKNKVVKIGERPESVTKGFGGKYYVTVMNSPDEEGDAVIKMLDEGKVSVFAKGLNEPKGIAFTGDYLVTADQTRVMKIDSKGNVSILAEKKSFKREVSFLNDVAVSHDRKSVFVTDMGAISKMFDPDKERSLWPLESKQAKELPAIGCVYQITLDGKITDAVSSGQKDVPGPNGVGRSGKEGLLLGDFFTGNIVRKTAKGKLRVIAKGLRGADAVEPDGKGGIYVSSWTQGKVWKLTENGKKKELILDGLKSAADLFVDRKAKKLIVPDMLAGTLIFVDIK
ncbi:MAG: gluconolaconase [Limisphaerales bacterium]|nr:MAG: gluconolaconase [Limisphaerales bacterium]